MRVAGSHSKQKKGQGQGAYDFERLERAVEALLESGRRLQVDNETLRSQLGERERQIHSLDERVLEANQRRQDAIKRIDDLIAHIDQLDAQLERGGSES